MNTSFYIEDYNQTTYKNMGIGQIYFKNVSVNNSSHKVILSGTFGFSANAPTGKSKKISYGRFDYSIGELIFLTE